MMKAWILNSIGNIRLSDTDVPMPGSGEVRIKVMAAGICGSDIPRIYNTGAHRMPLIPGHEFSGVVEGIGKNTPTYWMGKRVGVYPLIPCMDCEPCRSGHYEMCRNYDYVGSRRDGAFAEYVTVPATNLIELPDAVSYEEAAMLEPMAVAVHAMRIGVTVPAMRTGLDGLDIVSTMDAKIVVCGLGTIGMLLTMFLIECGFENIYVIGNKDCQKDRVTALGIPEQNYYDSRRVNAGSKDVVSWLKDTVGGADVFFECVGKNECMRLGIESAAPGAYCDRKRSHLRSLKTAERSTSVVRRSRTVESDKSNL